MPLALASSFFEQPTCDLARELLGQRLLVHSPTGLVGGRIVEVEAYLHHNDAACHTARGQTNRNQSMFGPPGRVYVYAIHNRWCMNIVTERAGLGAAVLIRAIEPDRGLNYVYQNVDLWCP